MLIQWCLLSVLAAAAAKLHKITLWTGNNFKNKYLTLTMNKIEHCETLPNPWRSIVNSLNVSLDCFEVYDDVNCTGHVRYMYTSTPSYRNLSNVGFGDKIKSLRLCDLDESAVDGTSQRPLSPNRPEKEFWEFLFKQYGLAELRQFQDRVSKSWLINWDFLPNVTGSNGHQYQYALEWTMDVIASRRFSKDDLKQLRDQAWQVVEDRVVRNSHSSEATSRSDAVRNQLELIWKQLLEQLNDEIDSVDKVESKQSNVVRQRSSDFSFWENNPMERGIGASPFGN